MDWHEFSRCFIQKHHKLACPHAGIYQSMSYSTVVRFALKKKKAMGDTLEGEISQGRNAI